MAVTVSSETIKEIAELLETGMKCFYHIPDGELVYYPDELNGYAGFNEEPWSDSMDKVEENYHAYLRFETMESHESFQVMETFVANIPDQRIRQRFENAIAFKKPFHNFKFLLLNYN